jgi:hypothetical protein
MQTRRRPIIAGKDLVILGLLGTIVYLVRKQQIVIQPLIDTSGLTSGGSAIAAALSSLKQG